MKEEAPVGLEEHPYLAQIVAQLGPEDPSDLIVHREAALPLSIEVCFDRTFTALEKRARPVTSREHLNQIAEEWVTTKTKDGVAVYNQEKYPARIKKHTRHTTPLRDVEITSKDLHNMESALADLSEDTPIYKTYVKAGTGSEEHWFEMYFTPEGAKLAQVANIMLEASFEKPEGVAIEGRYFAMPEYQDVTDNENPLELIYMNDEGKANIFVGGTTYPGDIYKPICKAMNAWVYRHGGAEIHAGAVVLSYNDPENGLRKKKVQIISGLSLHGKTTLATAQLMEELKIKFAEDLDASLEQLNLEYEILHDDYVFLKAHDDGQVEIGCYAPHGIFPAMKGENPEGTIATHPESVLYNTVIDPDGRPNFEESFPFVTREEQIKPTKNLRAAAVIETLGMKVVENGWVVNPTDISIITLTRDPDAPSVTKWQTPHDLITYWAGLVVAPTDATVERAEGLYLNYMCTDFDVAPRGPYMRRLKELWQKIQERNINIAGYTVNTGIPEKPESVAAVQSILLGLMKDDDWVWNDDLSINYAQIIPGFTNTPYIPWVVHPELNFILRWRERQKEREAHFAEKRISFEKAGLSPTALI